MTTDGRSRSESAILVPVPEVEHALSRLRDALDPSARLGVPAHVTTLVPFVAPDEITDAVLTAARTAVAAVPRFGCRFARTAWFGESVVWLAPDPDDPFRALRVAAAEVLPNPPVSTEVSAAWLICGGQEPGSWHILERLPLGD